MRTTIVYLLHFSRPYRHCRHYIGSTTDLQMRLDRHESGDGAKLLRAVREAGITWECVRTWEGGRDLEKDLKRRKKASHFCPICQGVK